MKNVPNIYDALPRLLNAGADTKFVPESVAEVSESYLRALETDGMIVRNGSTVMLGVMGLADAKTRNTATSTSARNLLESTYPTAARNPTGVMEAAVSTSSTSTLSKGSENPLLGAVPWLIFAGVVLGIGVTARKAGANWPAAIAFSVVIGWPVGFFAGMIATEAVKPGSVH